MDIPQVLQRIRPGQDWGPMAQTGVLYADFAPLWRDPQPVPTEAEMEATWQVIVAEQAAEQATPGYKADQLQLSTRVLAALVEFAASRIAVPVRPPAAWAVVILNNARQLLTAAGIP